ncbi:hypothetical protein Peur_068470 [Populus x canadensis]
MKSDSYMFSPFISTPHIASKTSSSSTTGQPSTLKKITMEVPTRKLTTKDNQSTVETSNVTVEDQFSELPEKCISGQQKFVHKETVKHMVYQSCRSSLSVTFLCHVHFSCYLSGFQPLLPLI